MLPFKKKSISFFEGMRRIDRPFLNLSGEHDMREVEVRRLDPIDRPCWEWSSFLSDD